MAPHERLVLLCVMVLVMLPMQVLSAADMIPLEIKQAMAAGRTAEALPWLMRAAGEGNTIAALYLGKLYLSGSGVRKDPALARRYLQQSASGEVVEAQLMLGHLMQEAGDLQAARNWFEKAAASGNTRAAAWLAANPAHKNPTEHADIFRRIDARSPDMTGLGEAELNRRDATGASPLIRAVQVNSPDWVIALLARHADVSAVDHAGNSALHYAVLEDSSGILEALLPAGAPINLKNKLGSTPLHGAVSQKQLANVELLVSHGADLGSMDGNGWTPVMLAERLDLKTSFANQEKRTPGRLASSDTDHAADVLHAVRVGKLDDLNQMVEQGVAVNVLDASGNSPLHIATMQRHGLLVGPLIAAGADVNGVNARGLTASMIAAQAADPANLALLLTAEADVKLSDIRGRTALHQAVLSGCGACVKLLIDSGSDVTSQDRSGATPLLLALRESPDLAENLLKVSGDALQLRDENDRDALWIAVAAGNDRVVQALLGAGLVMRADREGTTPLHTAARMDRVDLAALLLESSGAAIHLNARTAADNTPLMLASYHDSARMVRVLIDAGAGVEEQNAVGDTALHLAVRQGGYGSARLLVESGASFNQRNETGQSARSIIEATNDQKWLDLLTLGPSGMQRLLHRITQN